MVEYVMLSAESAIRIVRGWTTQLQPATLTPGQVAYRLLLVGALEVEAPDVGT